MQLLRNRSYPRLVLYALVIALGIGLIVGASTSGAAFGTYTHSWEGTSELRSEAHTAGAETIVATDTTQYEDTQAEGTVGIAIATDEPYDPEDRERITDFVRRGGTLVIADDIGHTNQLLQEMGASTRIEGEPLRDEREYYRSPALPIATQTADHPYVSDSESFTLNYGTALAPNGADVLIQSSEYAYLDTNRNQQFDGDESLGARPVMTTEEIGEGQVVVISDSSSLINVMLERPGNRAFVEQLFAAHDRVLIDQSQATDLPALALAMLALRDSAVLQLLFVTGLIGAVAVLDQQPGWLQRLRDRFGRSGEVERLDVELQPTDLRAILEAQHPEWDANRRERVMKVVMNRRKKGDDDD
ncbi:DUF4350 domain-containing protein [Halalkalicoccus salilacus]|uniref:DUF4350 domain-containing protein n=1 Tax=Halalkalicoccus salilacus TaxID=3117459 RepID=UPI00300F288B